jgi:hypothetical protein
VAQVTSHAVTMKVEPHRGVGLHELHVHKFVKLKPLPFCTGPFIVTVVSQGMFPTRFICITIEEEITI